MDEQSRAIVARFSAAKSLAFASVIVGSMFLVAEVVLRFVGVQPRVRPRILLRAIDVDIEFPFMKPDLDTFWAPRPFFQGDFLGKTVSINALGLRGPDVQMPKPRGRKRVACFGDSITFGYGVSDNESYCALVGDALRGRDVDLVNAAVTGFTSHQVLARLKRVAVPAGADIATICIGWNDGNRRAMTDRQYARSLRRSMAVEGLLDHSYIYRAMTRMYLAAQAHAASGDARENRVPLDEYRENLREIVAWSRAHAIAPVFVTLPMRHLPGESPGTAEYPRAFDAIAKDLAVPLIEIGPLAYDAPVADTRPYFLDSLHLTVEGNRVMAEAIARQLEQAGLVPKDAS